MNKAILGFAALLAVPAVAADHLDSPDAVTVDPATDISDLYAWNNAAADKVNLVLNVGPLGGADGFSDAVYYVFNIDSRVDYAATTETNSQIICEFDAAQVISCWGGGQYVTGDASVPAGITSAEGGLKVFAGERDDPFFMEFTGFTEAVAAVGNAGVAAADPAVCPTAVDAATAGVLGDLLSGNEEDANGMIAGPIDTFAGSNVQSIVVQIDTALVNAGGALFAVHAGTYIK